MLVVKISRELCISAERVFYFFGGNDCGLIYTWRDIGLKIRNSRKQRALSCCLDLEGCSSLEDAERRRKESRENPHAFTPLSHFPREPLRRRERRLNIASALM